MSETILSHYDNYRYKYTLSEVWNSRKLNQYIRKISKAKLPKVSFPMKPKTDRETLSTTATMIMLDKFGYLSLFEKGGVDVVPDDIINFVNAVYANLQQISYVDISRYINEDYRTVFQQIIPEDSPIKSLPRETVKTQILEEDSGNESVGEESEEEQSVSEVSQSVSTTSETKPTQSTPQPLETVHEELHDDSEEELPSSVFSIEDILQNDEARKYIEQRLEQERIQFRKEQEQLKLSSINKQKELEKQKYNEQVTQLKSLIFKPSSSRNPFKQYD